MKRFLSVDFMRGFAIMGMILLHVFIEVFDTQIFLDAVQEGEGNIGFIIFAVVIVFFASFAGFFIMLSAFANFISMDKKYKKLVEMGVNSPHKVVRNAQVTRGLITLFLGYFIHAVMYPFVMKPLAKWLAGEEISVGWDDLVDELFWFSVIRFLGLATIIVALVYTSMLKRKMATAQILKSLWIIVIVLYLITPVILYVVRSIEGFWPGPWRGWEERDILTNIFYFLLLPIAGKEQPLFPWIIASFIGTIIGLEVQTGGLTKKFRQKWTRRGLLMFFLGIILQVVFSVIAGELEGVSQERFEYGFGIIFGAQDRSSSYMLFVGGAEVMIFTGFMRSIEGKGRTTNFAKNTVIFRRSGMVTLSVFGWQALSYVPIVLLERAFGLEPGEQQSNFWQMWVILIVSMVLWFSVIWVWEKINFIGSYEWIAASLLSIGDKGKKSRINPQEVLYNVEPMGIPLNEEQNE